MSVHKDKKRGTWYFRKRVYNFEGRLVHVNRSGYKTKYEAKVAELSFNEYESRKLKDIKLFELGEEYLISQETKIKESTLYTKKLIFENWIKPYFSNVPIIKINVIFYKKWVEYLKTQNITIGRINKILNEMKYIFQYANDYYGMRNNPAKLFGTLKDTSYRKTKMKIWDIDQFEQFIVKVKEPMYKLLFNFLYFTGCRISEALALTWDCVDFDSKQVYIEKSLCSKGYENGSYKLISPKSTSSIRHILLTKKLFNNLKKYKTEGNDPKNIFVFGGDEPLSRTTVDRKKRLACDLAGLEYIRLHDFRHSHASLLIKLKIEIIYISARLGHSKISTTLDIYSHLFPSRQQEIVELLNNL